MERIMAPLCGFARRRKRAAGAVHQNRYFALAMTP